MASFALQLAIHHVGVLQMLFGMEPIALIQCFAWTALGLMPFLVLEGRKGLRRSGAAGASPGEAPA
jgi:Ca2+-transporting ATPase